MTDRSEIDAFLAAEKKAVSPMNWREKLSRKDPQWWEFVSAVEVNGVVVEDAQMIVQWRPAKGAAQDKYNCAFLFRGLRVYAVDVDADGQHTNKVGKGRSWFGKKIGPGTHEHTWSEDGEGYVEPIEPSFVSLMALFEYFCRHAKVNVNSGFVPPPSIQLPLI